MPYKYEEVYEVCLIRTCWVYTDEELSAGVHEVQDCWMADPASRAGQHQTQVEAELVLNI